MLTQSTATAIMLGIFGVSGVVSSFLCLIYIVYRLKLNHYIKRILLAHTVQNLIAQLIIGCSLVLVLAFRIQNFTTCSLFYGPVIVTLTGGHIMAALIAVIRYHMASNTANNVNINHQYIDILTFGVMVGHFILHVVFFTLNGVLPNGVYLMISNCARIENGGNKEILGAHVILIMAALAVGTLYDAKMVKLVRAQAKVEPIRLVSWQPPRRTQNDSQEIKDTIPVNATILSSSSMVANLIITGFLYKLNVASHIVVLTMALMLWSIIQMPLILSLTVKSQHKKTGAARPEIPRSLQFHERDEDASSRATQSSPRY